MTTRTLYIFLSILFLVHCGTQKSATSLKNNFFVKINVADAKVASEIECKPLVLDNRFDDAKAQPGYTYEWLSSNSADGVFAVIANENSKTLTLTNTLAHTFIKCRAANRPVTGEDSEALSDAMTVVDSKPVGTDIEFYGTNLASFNVSIGLDNGVTDADGDIITSIQTQNVENGTLGAWSCTDSLCTAKFFPSASLASGAKIFEYKAKNAYAEQAEWATATVNISSSP